jgi:hypothetical protein
VQQLTDRITVARGFVRDNKKPPMRRLFDRGAEI